MGLYICYSVGSVLKGCGLNDWEMIFLIMWFFIIIYSIN